MHIAIDTGGTFTDCVYVRDGALEILKLFSTPDDPGRALLECVSQISGAASPRVRHGTTVGTNTLLERKGARVAFVTTAGFEDTIAIGRQARAHLYNWFATPPDCIVPRELRFGVPERTAPDGRILRRPAAREIEDLVARVGASGAESIAISLLFAFANPENETLVARALGRLGKPVSVSHIILPEFREYERAATVTVNAYLAPRVGTYLGRLSNTLGEKWRDSSFEVMQSSGGIVPAAFASERPVRTVLSGPAGGVIGAYLVAARAGLHKIIAFDMGGTSTDVSLIDAEEGGPATTSEAVVSGIPISVPMLDIHTVGAGGGSIARFDEAGVLHVGPESAGANPGPICYGKGTAPTVSDANLMLGRIHPQRFLGGKLELDVERTRSYMEASRGPIASVEDFAAGIVQLAEAAMERAIRIISVERGHNPQEFTLVAFGGAGPLHACGLAKALRIPRVLAPKFPGALSAIGVLLADTVRDYSNTVMVKADAADADLESHFAELERLADAESQGDGRPGVLTRSLDVRYAGQGYELNVPAGKDFAAAFHNAHRRRYGYADETRQLEIVNVRLRKTIPGDVANFERSVERTGDGGDACIEQRPAVFSGARVPTKVYDRDRLRAGDTFEGPAMVVEYSATTVILPGCVARVDRYENLVIEVPC